MLVNRIFRSMLQAVLLRRALLVGLQALALVFTFTANSFASRLQADVLNVSPAVLKIPLSDLKSGSHSLAELSQGKPMYIKFWASWCHECIQQMPHFQQAYEKYGKQVQFVAVNIDINDDRDSVSAVQKRFKLGMPIWMDSTGRLAQSFDLVGTPYSVLLNSQAKVIHTGHSITEELESKLASLASGAETNNIGSHATKTSPKALDIYKESKAIVLFSASWCDDYLSEKRPEQSANCKAAYELINQLQKQRKDLAWQGFITRLWTGDEELKAFQQRNNLDFPIFIDTQNKEFLKFDVKDFPTLLLLKNGKEVERFLNFKEAEQVKKEVLNF